MVMKEQELLESPKKLPRSGLLSKPRLFPPLLRPENMATGGEAVLPKSLHPWHLEVEL
jgi:hypothetical protein